MGRRVQVRLAAIEAEVRSHGRKLGEIPKQIEGAERRLSQRIRSCERGIIRLNRTVLDGGLPEPPWGDLVANRQYRRVDQMKAAGREWKKSGFGHLMTACRRSFVPMPDGFPSVRTLYSYCIKRGRKEMLRNWMETQT